VQGASRAAIHWKQRIRGLSGQPFRPLCAATLRRLRRGTVWFSGGWVSERHAGAWSRRRRRLYRE